MDKAELIIKELARIASQITPGIPVEIDRRLDISDEHDLPLIVVRSGEEETAAPEGANPAVWARRRKMSPSVEVYFQAPINQQRAESSRIWLAFLDAMKASGIQKMLAQGTGPGVKRTLAHPEGATDICCLLIELELVFDR